MIGMDSVLQHLVHLMGNQRACFKLRGLLMALGSLMFYGSKFFQDDDMTQIPTNNEGYFTQKGAILCRIQALARKCAGNAHTFRKAQVFGISEHLTEIESVASYVPVIGLKAVTGLC